jgi:hypothetical protein
VNGTVNAKIKVDGIIPKLNYISEEAILGGRYGGYIAIPLLKKSRDVVVSVTTPLPAALQQKSVHRHPPRPVAAPAVWVISNSLVSSAGNMKACRLWQR